MIIQQVKIECTVKAKICFHHLLIAYVKKSKLKVDKLDKVHNLQTEQVSMYVKDCPVNKNLC